MVGNLKKTCNVCYKSMRGDNLKKHMKKHERGNEDNVATNEDQISCTDEELEKRVSAKMKEFNRKIELGRKLNIIVKSIDTMKMGLIMI